MSYIRTIKPNDEPDESLKQVYAKLGQASQAHILQLQSLNPQALSAHYELYRSLMLASSPLSRKFREMIAFTVSRVNGCHY